MEENSKEDTSSNSVKKIIFILGFLLFLLIVFLAVIYFRGFDFNILGKGYFIYEGEGGKYRIDLVKFGNMTDYHLHVDINNKHRIYIFRNDPRDLEEIYLESSIKDKIINKQKVYVTQDVDEIGSKSLIGIMEFNQILGKNKNYGAVYNLYVERVFTDEEVSGKSIITCDNVNESIGVIYLDIGDENKVYSDGECVIIEGVDDDNLLLSSEKFAYHLLEVF